MPEPRIPRRAFLQGAVGLGVTSLLAGCGGSSGGKSASGGAAGGLKAAKDGDTLNLFAWEGYFADSTIKGFEQKTGISVKQTYITSSDDQFQKIASKLPFDVAIGNSTFLPQVVQAKRLRQIPHDQLAHYDEVESYFRNPYFDPGAKYSVPYAMAPMGLAYRADQVSGLKGSWTDLWDQAQAAKGHIYLPDDSHAVLQLALAHLGLDQNTSDSAVLDKAAKALIELKPYLGGFGSTNTIQLLSGTKCWMVPSYTGNVFTALSKAKDAGNLRFELCKESQMFNDDVMCIPASAKSPGNALLFIDYMITPANMAANVKYIGYPVPTKTGMSTYNSLVKDEKWLQVGADLVDQPTAWQHGLTAQQRQVWNQAWVTVKSA